MTLVGVHKEQTLRRKLEDGKNGLDHLGVEVSSLKIQLIVLFVNFL